MSSEHITYMAMLNDSHNSVFFKLFVRMTLILIIFKRNPHVFLMCYSVTPPFTRWNITINLLHTCLTSRFGLDDIKFVNTYCLI